MMNTEPKITINHLNVFYQKLQALSDISLAIPANQIFTLFGPANSGTTTLLRTLNRLNDLIPGTRTEGEILLDQQNIQAADVSVTELRRRVGMVFEEPVPLPMSIFDNIAYGPRMTGIKNRSELRDRVENALRSAVLWDEVKDRLNSPAMRLSGGQQQRLCIARSLSLNPEVIMLDRPCSGLDPISTAKVEESLQQLKEHFTIILVPHNVQQAARVADRAAFLLSGSLIEEGSADEFFANPKDERTSNYITGRFG
jgi:phosphate transport system ATP-binding protein